MPSCVVKKCRNNSKLMNKCHGITFHMFPSNSETKSKWIAAIRNSRNDQQWLPSKTSVVCSDHFDIDDLYTTNQGLRRVNRTKYPKKNLSDLPDVTVDDTTSSSASSAFAPDLSDCSDEAVDDTALPSTSAAAVSEILDLSVVAVDHTALSSKFSSTVPQEIVCIPDMAVDHTPLSSASSAAVPQEIVCVPDMAVDHTPLSSASSAAVPQEIVCIPDMAVDHTPLSSASSAAVPEILYLPDVAVDHTALPSASSTIVSNLPDEAVDDSLSSASSASAPVLPVSPTKLKMKNKEESAYDTPRMHKLRQKLNCKDKVQKNNKNKIKILNQKVRRLESRNKLLKNICSFKKQQLISPELHDSLNGNTTIIDILKNLNQKRLKKNIIYTAAVKEFCLTLNYHSPKAYEYVRNSFNNILPHPKTVSKWYGSIRGFTEEALEVHTSVQITS